MRISIVGSPASGKTYLAEAISKKLSVPHIHLDRFWFEAGGNEVKKDASAEEREQVRTYIREKVSAAIAADSWVSDGLYTRSVQPGIAQCADIIIFLDISLWHRLLNHAQRIFKPSTRHTELSLWHELTFFFEIIRRQFKNKSKLNRFINEHRNKIVMLKSRKEIERYLNNLSI